MGQNAVNQIMEKRLKAILPVSFPIDYDNVKFIPTDGETFVSLRTENPSSELKSIKCSRKHYLSTIKISVPKNEGTEESDELVDLIEGGFIPYQEGYLSCKTSTVQRLGNFKNWYQVSVLIAIEYDNIT